MQDFFGNEHYQIPRALGNINHVTRRAIKPASVFDRVRSQHIRAKKKAPAGAFSIETEMNA